MQLIDSHCHLDFPVFDQDREQILAECLKRGIEDIIVPAVTADTWDRLLAVCDSSPMLHYALGMHPMFMNQHQAQHIEQLSKKVEQTNPVAIGEIGLDFFVEAHDKQAQISLFEQQLSIAKKFDLPVILHIRKAYDQALILLKKHKIHKGIVHAFSGSEQQAHLYIKQGFLLGIGGVISYDNATKIRRIFQTIPLTHIALETDAPDMPLSTATEKRNTPTKITDIISTLAFLRKKSILHVATITTTNIKQLIFQK
jgi:TatD DNase family protein